MRHPKSSQRLISAPPARQLTILESEQSERAAQAAKKPKLQLFIGAIPVTTAAFNVLHPTSYPTRDETDTSMTVDLTLFNAGTTTATKVTFRIIVGASDVSLQSSERLERPNEPPETTTKTSLIRIDSLRPGVQIPMSLTLTYPKGRAPFEMTFTGDADQIETVVILGTVNIKPRKPSN